MNRELVITPDAIDVAALSARTPESGSNGAVISFTGVVRGREGEKNISALEYECFEKMALHQFNLIFEQAAARWPVQSLRLVHRIGVVKVGEPSLWMQVTAPHRAEAFAACQWIIDEMKRVVPIWKKQLSG